MKQKSCVGNIPLEDTFKATAPPASTSAKTVTEDSTNTFTNTDKISNTMFAENNPPHDTPKASSEEAVTLKKELGLLEGVTMITGVIIGSGIFMSPKGVIMYSGSVGMSLIVWVSCGMISTLGALCFAELGTMIPESGGMYSYISEAFGPLLAFMYVWVKGTIGNTAGSAVLALTFANYLLQAVLSDCDTVPDVPKRLIAAALICFLTWINTVNVKWVANVQTVLTATKVLALILIIVMGMNYLASGHLDNYRDPMEGTNWSPTAISKAFLQCLFSYGGWNVISFLVEEMKNPNRNIPLAIVIGTVSVTIIYTLTNVAYMVVLSPAEMLSSSAVAVSFANRTLGVLAWTIPLFVTLSTFGGMNGAVFTQARQLFVAARKKQLPEAFTLLHATRFTPIPAILLNGVLCLLMLSTSDVVTLINYSTYCETLIMCCTMCTLFWFRYKQPQRSRPFKVPLVLPILFTLSQLLLVVLPLIDNPTEVGVSLGLIATALPVYYLTLYRKEIPDCCSKPLQQLTYYCQLLFLGIPEEKID